MVTSLLFGGESLSSTSCNGGAESGVLLGLAAGAERETPSGRALGYLLLISVVSYSFLRTKCGEAFWFFSALCLSAVVGKDHLFCL